MSRLDRLRRASIAARSGPSPTITSGQSSARALGDVDEVRRAFVRCELAEIERIRAVERRRRCAAVARRPATSTGLGMISSRVDASSGARARRSAAIVELTAMMASAAARPARLRARLAAHVRDHRQRQRPERPAARTDAPRHHRRRAGGAERRSLARVDQVRPVAHRPVVAHGADHRAPVPVRGLYRGQDVSTCWAWTRSTSSRGDDRPRRVRQLREQTLVLEVVPDVGQRSAPESRPRDRECRRSRARARPAGVPGRGCTTMISWPRARRPRASSYVLHPLPPQTGGNESVGGGRASESLKSDV